MDAITLLKQQHREVEKLFAAFEDTDGDEEKVAIFEKIADSLAIHATIEERHFYPAVRARQTEEEIEEAYDEHLDIKMLLQKGVEDTEAPGFDGLVAAIKGAVEHHIDEEEGAMFPEVKKLMTAEALEAIGQAMEAEFTILMQKGNARFDIRVESEAPAVSP
jgi:hemerythrin superfamily protein